MKILIIRLSSIGDCVMASPVVAALREAHPGAHLTWAVQSKSAAVVRGLPGLDEVLEWNSGDKNGMLRALYQTRRARFDVALDLQGLDKSALFLLASRAKTRITGASARALPRRFATKIVPEERKIHARDFYFGRAAALGLAPDVKARFFPVLPLQNAHHEAATRILRENRCEASERLIGLNLGASIAANRWAPQNFARLAHALLQDGAPTRVALLGAPADAPLWEEFEAAFATLARSVELRPRLLPLVGKTGLLELAALSRHFAAFVTADTGPMHLAAAMGAPVLALFGPARLWRTAPIQNPNGAPIRVLDASQITGSWPAPMSAHTVEAVLEATREMAAQNMGAQNMTAQELATQNSPQLAPPVANESLQVRL